MKQITTTQLEAILRTIKGATFITMNYVGKNDVLNKGGRANALFAETGIEAERIEKHSKVGLFIGESAEYEKMVNNRLKKEGKEQITFEGGELPYGSWIVPNLLLDNGKGAVQLRTYADIMNNSKTEVKYLHEGVEIDPKAEKFDKFRKPAKKESTNQGTDRTIKPRNYFLSGIKEITIGGETYLIQH